MKPFSRWVPGTALTGIHLYSSAMGLPFLPLEPQPDLQFPSAQNPPKTLTQGNAYVRGARMDP